MKPFLSIIAFLFAMQVQAATYYFSNTDGDDSRSAAQAQSNTTPWKTLSKLTTVMATTLTTGDQVLFKRGDTFYGSILFSKGSLSFGAYGTGANPIITGLQDVTGWTSIGTNLYQSTATVSTLSTLNMVVVNGVFQKIAQFPNTGYNTFQTSSGATSLTSTTLAGKTWTGGQVVVRKQHWILDKSVITSQSGNTINFTNPSGAYTSIPAGYGFIIQNTQIAADTQGEWWYDAASKKLGMYSVGTPAGVKVANIDVLVNSGSFSNISFTNIDIVGSNGSGYSGSSSNNISFNGCVLNFHGTNGFSLQPAMTNFTINNCSGNWFMNNCINGNNSSNLTVTNCDFENIGMVAGMGNSGDGTYAAISNAGANCLIQYNTIRNVGYIGIEFKGNACRVLNNLIDHSNAVKDDGAGIYTFTGPTAVTYTMRYVLDNIVINGGGAHLGTNTTNDDALGIYMDDNTSEVTIARNTVYNCGSAGIYLHAAHNIIVRDNNIFGNVTTGFYGQLLITGQGAYEADLPVTGLNVKNNRIVSRTVSQFVATFNTTAANMNGWGSFDSNYYCRPISEGATLSIKSSNQTLAQWRTLVNGESHSKTSPKTITNVNQFFFDYNASSSPVTRDLDATYMDVDGVTTYSGSVIIPPWSSKILIYASGTIVNKPPIALIAGGNKTITLPTNSVVLDGSGSSDPDGNIASYTWAKVTGTGGAITSGASTATASSLTAGQYLFSLTVKDNLGATATTNVTVNVNPAANQAPTANAGPNQTVTLPTSVATLNGSGSSDPESGPLTYAWSKLAGSPSGGTISNTAISSPSLSGLIQGLYTYQLVVTDNGGLTSTSTVRINVAAAANTNPIANAGTNQVITLPTNIATLNGSASTDPDGTISSYAWSKISGPATFTITNAGVASTTATNLVQGTYQFKLLVTDNSSATGADTLTVIVNAKPVVNPVANAGPNITITLPKDSTTLNGTASTDNESISAYLWEKVSGPTGGTIANSTNSTTRITALQLGTYSYSLTVTDNDGNMNKDTMTVIVNPAVAKPPVINAGEDIFILMPDNSVSLSDSLSVYDTTVASRIWRFVSTTAVGGFTDESITDPTSAETGIENLHQGIYGVTYTATDILGQSGSDIIYIEVDAAEGLPNQVIIKRIGGLRRS